MYESRKMLVHQTARPADVSRMSRSVASALSVFVNMCEEVLIHNPDADKHVAVLS